MTNELPYQTYERVTGKKWTGGNSADVQNAYKQYGITAPAGSAEGNLALQKALQNLKPQAPQNTANQPDSNQEWVTETRMDGDGNPYQVRIKNPVLNKVNQSTTTISNTNKIETIPKLNNSLDNLTNKGITTGEDGTTTYADGSIYEKPSDTTSSDTQDEDKEIESMLTKMKESLDASTKTLIDNIQAKYAIRKSEQKEINRRQEKGVSNALLMGGVTGQGSSAQYAPISSSGIVQAQESFGIKQLADLDAEENDLIAAAKAAQQSGDFKMMEFRLNQAEKKRQEKITTAIKLNEEIAKQNKEIRDRNMQVQRENAILDLYKSGNTDPASITQALKKQGVNATIKEVADVVALASGIGGSGIVGEYNFYKADAIARGQVPVDFNTYQTMDANRKIKIASAGTIANENGLTPKETQTFLSITNKFQADAFINNALKGQNAITIADQVIADPKNAANQLKSLYTLVKNLDPDSAVREGEISLANKTQSYLNRFGTTLTRVFKGKVISDKAAVELAEATKELALAWSDTAKRRQTQYQAQANIAGIGDAFSEYISSSDLGYAGPVKDEEDAKQSVVNYGNTNPNAREQIKAMVADGLPYIKIKQVLNIP